jgi:hypothetical protein
MCTGGDYFIFYIISHILEQIGEIIRIMLTTIDAAAKR